MKAPRCFGLLCPLLLAACASGPAEPAPAPPATSQATAPATAPATSPGEGAPLFEADPSVLPSGRFKLERVETSTIRHGMERVGSSSERIVIELELGDDGAARLCTTTESLRSSDVSRYASRSGEHEHSEERHSSRVGRSGRFSREGAGVVLRLSREEPDCDPGRGLERAIEAVRCTPGRLSGHELLACEPALALGGERAALPFARPAPLVLLGRPRLAASFSVQKTTIDPPGSGPDPADPAAWSLRW